MVPRTIAVRACLSSSKRVSNAGGSSRVSVDVAEVVDVVEILLVEVLLVGRESLPGACAFESRRSLTRWCMRLRWTLSLNLSRACVKENSVEAVVVVSLLSHGDCSGKDESSSESDDQVVDGVRVRGGTVV